MQSAWLGVRNKMNSYPTSQLHACAGFTLSNKLKASGCVKQNVHVQKNFFRYIVYCAKNNLIPVVVETDLEIFSSIPGPQSACTETI